MDDFEKEIKAGFLEEAAQLLADSEQAFLSLETAGDDPSIVDRLFRLAHNLKGSARAVGFDGIGEFTHQLESLLLKVKHNEIAIDAATITLLLRCNDHLKGMVDTLKKDMGAQIDCTQLLGDIVQRLEAKSQAPVPSPAPVEQVEPAPVEPVHVETASVVPALVQPEDMAPPEDVPAAASFPEEEPLAVIPVAVTQVEVQPAPPAPPAPQAPPVMPTILPEALKALEALRPPEPVKLADPVPVAPPSEPVAKVIPIVSQPVPKPAPVVAAPPVDKGSKVGSPSSPSSPANPASPSGPVQQDESIRVSLRRLERLMNNVGELVILQAVLNEQKFSVGSTLVQKTIDQLAKITKDIQDISMSLRMVPLKQTFQKMQRIVRDTSKVLNKDVQLVIQGEETELDKTVLELVGDPLVHLVRNAVDHGLETTADRVAAGKPEQGTVTLKAYHQGNHIIIEVKDNGKGLDARKLIAKAIEKGILKSGDGVSDEQAYQLIFASGFSTKEQVTDISGRGVGMDVVRNNIHQLQGEIQVETKLGEGTCMRILLPLTLSIIDGMVVKCMEERFVVPIAQVYESVQPEREDLHYVSGLGEVLSLRGESLPLHRLGPVLGRRQRGAMRDAADSIAIVVRSAKTPFAVLVDDIIGQQQVVIKRLGQEVRHIKGITGGAILGDGRPSLILDLGELISKGIRNSSVVAIRGVA